MELVNKLHTINIETHLLSCDKRYLSNIITIYSWISIKITAPRHPGSNALISISGVHNITRGWDQLDYSLANITVQLE